MQRFEMFLKRDRGGAAVETNAQKTDYPMIWTHLPHVFAVVIPRPLFIREMALVADGEDCVMRFDFSAPNFLSTQSAR